MSKVSAFVGGLAVSCLLASPSFAQNGYCMRNGQPDQQATQTFQRMLQQPDQQVMQTMAGTWYTVSQSPGTNQVSYSYSTYEPNGSWSYQNRVCGGMTGYCSDYQGYGVFAGVPLGNGQISLVIMYSDTQVTNACIGSVVQPIGNGTLRDSNGQTWQRVR